MKLIHVNTNTAEAVNICNTIQMR